MRLNILHAMSLLVISLAPAPALSFDAAECKDLFASPSSADSFVNAYRSSRAFPLGPDAKTEELGYRIQSTLGQSTSIVYLATDIHSGASVVVKRSVLSLPVALSNAWRELAVTEYLLENGVEVPRILKTAITEGGVTVIAKEYFRGLTGQELRSLRNHSSSSLPKELSEGAWNSLEPERERLKGLFFHGAHGRPAFRVWYDTNKPRLIRKYSEIWSTIERLSLDNFDLKLKIRRDIYAQDFGIQNMLYDVRRKRWLAFDP